MIIGNKSYSIEKTGCLSFSSATFVRKVHLCVEQQRWVSRLRSWKVYKKKFVQTASKAHANNSNSWQGQSLHLPMSLRGRILSMISTQMSEKNTKETGSSEKWLHLIPLSTWTCSSTTDTSDLFTKRKAPNVLNGIKSMFIVTFHFCLGVPDYLLQHI